MCNVWIRWQMAIKVTIQEVLNSYKLSVQFSSVTQLCPTLCNPMNCSTPGLPVHHQLHPNSCHWVSDIIQPSHPLVVPFSSCPQSQHQGLFKWISSSYQAAKVLELQLQHQSFQWTPRTDFLQGDPTLQSKGLSRVFSNSTVQKHLSVSAYYL